MAAKLGANDAAFRLGNQAVSVYLGAVEVYAPGITLYYNNAEGDFDWATLGNWWLDEAETVAATALPTAADNVIAKDSINSNSSEAVPTVANFTLDAIDIGMNIELIVSGVATFNDSVFGSFNGSTLTGNAVFNGKTFNLGTVSGNATFNDNAYLAGAVTGTATFTDSACNAGGTAGTFVPDPPPACP